MFCGVIFTSACFVCDVGDVISSENVGDCEIVISFESMYTGLILSIDTVSILSLRRADSSVTIDVGTIIT